MSLLLKRTAVAVALNLAAFTAPMTFADADVETPDASTEIDADKEKDRKSSARIGSGENPWVGESVNVTARGTANDWPSALATDLVSYDAAIGSPSDFQDFITRVPGIGATGQNGIFETFSIRGSGANGILILLGGMPITAQRRAGVPVAFVEPSLLGEINVTRGPSVVHFGAGALGGAISIEPRWFDAPYVEAGYGTSGDESLLSAGIGNEHYSVAVAQHKADDSEAPNGTPLDTSFDRRSATLQYRNRFGEFEFDALLLPSRTEDIGKSNTRFPSRNTTYPEDSHTLGRLRLRHDNGFQVSVQGHDQYLGTLKQRSGRPDEFAGVSSTDYATTVQHTLRLDDDRFDFNFGVEYLARRDVDAYDAVGSVLNRTYSLRNGREDSWSLFAIGDWRASDAVELEFGARHTSVDQEQEGANADDSDTALTAGVVWTPTQASRFSFNIASGYRFATLEERYYSGVTAQGEIAGNPNLSSEHSRGIDLGYAVQAGNWQGQFHVWRTNVDDLIQQVELAEGLNGFVNIGEARLYGAEAAVAWDASEALNLRSGLTWVRGYNDLDEPIYGIPPVTLDLEARYKAGAFDFGARYTHRFSFTRPGFEELERDAVDIVDADIRYHATPSLDFTLYLRNAFNEDYFATSDELSAYAPERSIGLNARWTMH